VLVPVFLISLTSFCKIFNVTSPIIEFIGNKNIALLIGGALGIRLLARQRNFPSIKSARSSNHRWPRRPFCILITSAGGAFGLMLRNAGVGQAIQGVAAGHNINLILLSYLIALVIRIAQGSATIAMLTTSSIIYPMMQTTPPPYNAIYIYLSIGFGGVIRSWMNDSGFWVVSKLSGFTERETLSTWTVMLTAVSLIGLITTLLFATIITPAWTLNLPSINKDQGSRPAGSLPVTEDLLLNHPSGDLFWTDAKCRYGLESVGSGGKQFLILSTQGGLRAPDGKPIALGYHTGHWEIALLVQAAAEEFRRLGVIPFAAYCSDPCDGRTQGTPGCLTACPTAMMPLWFFGRLIRSLPNRSGVLGVATCDKGLPAMMMALASMHDLPCVLVPGGVTLPPSNGEDAGTVQTLGARYAHGMISLQEAADLGCRACGSPGGGCQFLAPPQPPKSLAKPWACRCHIPRSRRQASPFGQTWPCVQPTLASPRIGAAIKMRDILTPASIHNAMVLHAAFGGSTNLLLHVPAIAHAAGLRLPTVEDWIKG